ncbi:helix-turn-helix transcriptional regulator [Nonomuraea typhae]|uniref:helix-turn-helix transcriptional regulator n=1 Tax=Nonomuraea typhae TaxID=2603600 RepID=UPI0012F82B88|nr:LuxR family transcriptional regulator [Nonomuraea typhae]
MSVFVGREAELAMIQEVLADERPGGHRVVLIEGPEGIGKTALMVRLAAGLDRVRRASGAEYESGLPYGLLDQLGTGVSGGPELVAAVERRPGPVTLVIDNAQWADEPSLQAISYMVRRVRSARVVVLAAVRDTAAGRLFPADHTLRLHLDGLDVAAVGELCARQTGWRPSPREAARLRAHTEGNPLHLRSLLGDVPVRRLADLDAVLPAPRSLTGRVLADLAAAGPAAADLVAAVCVLDGQCALHLAAEVAGIAEPLVALERAIAAGLLAEECTGVVRLRRAVARPAVCQEYLGPSRRAALHRRAAALAGDRAGRLWHLSEAAVGPDPELARELAALGRRLADRSQWAQAARMLGAAARLSPDLAAELDMEAAEARIAVGGADPRGVSARLRTLPGTAWRGYALGLAELSAGRLEAAEAHLEQVWPAAGTPRLRGKVAGQLALLRLMQGHHRSAAEWNRQGTGELTAFVAAHVSQAPAPQAPAAAETSGALLGRAAARLWHDDLPGAREDLEDILVLGSAPSVQVRMLARILLAEADHLAGEWDSALEHCARAVQLGGESEQPLFVPLAQAVAAQVRAARGEWGAAERDIAAAHAGTPLARDRAARAAIQLAAARGDAEGVLAAWLARPLSVHRQDGLLVEAMVTLGKPAEAERLLDRAADGPPAAPASVRAARARARGALHAARRETEAAVAAFEDSLALLDGLDMPFAGALTDLSFGSWLRRLGRRNIAALRLERAHVVFEALGARPYVERSTRELSACGRAMRADRTGAGLTAQELAVAEHAARGMTNRQIASSLFVSVKTVEYHLSHVYNKLQVRSRTQLALLLTAGPS